MFDKLKDMITNYVDVDADSIEMDSRFAEDLGFNSYDFLCMLGDCEDEFGIDVDESVAGKKKTVGELVEYLEEQA